MKTIKSQGLNEIKTIQDTKVEVNNEIESLKGNPNWNKTGNEKLRMPNKISEVNLMNDEKTWKIEFRPWTQGGGNE